MVQQKLDFYASLKPCLHVLVSIGWRHMSIPTLSALIPLLTRDGGFYARARFSPSHPASALAGAAARSRRLPPCWSLNGNQK